MPSSTPRDGHEGLEKAHAIFRSVDLIILDIMLPRKDGFEVCQAIRAAGRSHSDSHADGSQPD